MQNSTIHRVSGKSNLGVWLMGAGGQRCVVSQKEARAGTIVAVLVQSLHSFHLYVLPLFPKCTHLCGHGWFCGMSW